jgi:diketogulonate reductase-like aldo/keto reductase
MSPTDRMFKLNTGQQMPAIGLGEEPLSFHAYDKTNCLSGTWQSEPGQVKQAVAYALKTGYRLIDCAYCYGNEDEVGEGLAEAFASGVVKREDVFVVSKVWATYNTRVELGLDKSLKSLGLEYVDLFLVVSFFGPFLPSRLHPFS